MGFSLCFTFYVHDFRNFFRSATTARCQAVYQSWSMFKRQTMLLLKSGLFALYTMFWIFCFLIVLFSFFIFIFVVFNQLWRYVFLCACEYKCRFLHGVNKNYSFVCWFKPTRKLILIFFCKCPTATIDTDNVCLIC